MKKGIFTNEHIRRILPGLLLCLFMAVGLTLTGSVTSQADEATGSWTGKQVSDAIYFSRPDGTEISSGWLFTCGSGTNDPVTLTNLSYGSATDVIVPAKVYFRNGLRPVYISANPNNQGSHVFSNNSPKTLTFLEVDGAKVKLTATTANAWLKRGINTPSGLKKIDFSGLDMNGRTDMGAMLAGHDSLEEVIMPDTTGVTSMKGLFSGSRSLKSIDMSAVDTSQVTDFSSMFSGCTGLTELDISGFDTSNATTFNGMFSSCTGVTTLDVKGFATAKVTDISSMFKNCTEMVYPDMGNWDLSLLTASGSKDIFTGCESLFGIVTPAKLSANAQIAFPDGVTMYDVASSEKTIYEKIDSSTPKSTWLCRDKFMTQDDFISDGTELESCIFTDPEHTIVPPKSGTTIYLNGSTKKNADGTKSVYNACTFYTTLTAPTYEVTQKGKTKTKTGKLLVGVTATKLTPTIEKNKIKADSVATAIASVSYKKKDGSLTVKAKKNSGSVYVWAITYTDAPQVYSCVKVNVEKAPTKLEIVDRTPTDTSAAVYKTDTRALKESTLIYVRPTISKSKEFVDTASYTAYPAKGSESYVEVSPYGDYCYLVVAKGLKNNKKTKAKVVVECDQNAKKATFTLTIENFSKGFAFTTNEKIRLADPVTNEATGYKSWSASMIAPTDKATSVGTVNITPTLSDGNFSATDKPKVYMMASPDGFSINEKGKVTITSKPTGENKKITAKLKDNVLTITAAKKVSTAATTNILVVYNTHENSGYFVIPVSLTETFAAEATDNTETTE